MHQKSKLPHCLLCKFLVPLACFVFLVWSLLSPRLRPIPSLGKPRFSPSSKTHALHHFCKLDTKEKITNYQIEDSGTKEQTIYNMGRGTEIILLKLSFYLAGYVTTSFAISLFWHFCGSRDPEVLTRFDDIQYGSWSVMDHRQIT